MTPKPMLRAEVYAHAMRAQVEIVNWKCAESRKQSTFLTARIILHTKCALSCTNALRSTNFQTQTKETSLIVVRHTRAAAVKTSLASSAAQGTQ